MLPFLYINPNTLFSSSKTNTEIDHTQIIKTLAGGIKRETKLTPKNINKIIDNRYNRILHQANHIDSFATFDTDFTKVFRSKILHPAIS